MRPVVALVLSAALALTLQPAFAQSPGAATMPAGTQNPAVAQPRLTIPPGGPLSPAATQPSGYQPGPQPNSAQPGPQPTSTQPSNFQPGPTPNQPAPSALIGPGDAGGLCECLINHDPNLPPYDKTMIHRSCTTTLDACQSSCNTGKYYSFVPHAVFSCPGQPEPNGHIAMNFTPVSRLFSRR